MNSLVDRLSVVGQPVVVGGPDPSLAELHQRITDLRYVFIKFSETQGGTDLGVRIDDAGCDLSGADFTAGTGTAHIEGTLTLDYVDVRCVADIDLATLRGHGHLLPVPTSGPSGPDAG